ncbi:alpha/beta fold hydrolase [Spirosoma jeollabukense]
MTGATTYNFLFEGNRLAYRKQGTGASMLLAFHGFGQSSLAYKPFNSLAGSQFTVFAIDLFFHGNSQYVSCNLLTKTDWQRLIGAFLQAHDIHHFSLVGFSLGGRFALATVEAFADRLDQLILIAPDGITRNGWYRLATNSGVGRRLFRYLLRHLPMLTTIGHTLTQLSLLNRTVMRFAEMSLGTSEQRDLVYQSWTQFRLIHPDLKTISKLLNTYPVRVRFFTGAFDRLVPGTYISPLTKQLRHYELTIFKTGHNHLIELTAEKLVQK